MSAAVAVATMIAAREVMLPFILAIVIAYVLTPLVASLERRKMSRGLAVLCVYAAVLGSFGAFAWAISPRIGHEFRNLRQEIPKMSEQAKDTLDPRHHRPPRRHGAGPRAAPVPEEPPRTLPTSAFVARPQPDGSIAIDVGAA